MTDNNKNSNKTQLNSDDTVKDPNRLLDCYYDDDEFEPEVTDDYDELDDDYYYSMKQDIDRLSDQIRSNE